MNKATIMSAWITSFTIRREMCPLVAVIRTLNHREYFSPSITIVLRGLVCPANILLLKLWVTVMLFSLIQLPFRSVSKQTSIGKCKVM